MFMRGVFRVAVLPWKPELFTVSHFKTKIQQRYHSFRETIEEIAARRARNTILWLDIVNLSYKVEIY